MLLRDALRRYRNAPGAPGGGTPPAPGAGTGTQDPPANTLSYDDWYKGLDDSQKALVDGNTSGLKSALQSERSSRQALEKQVAELAKKAEKGSEIETQLGQLQAQLSEANQRAEFLAGAPAAGCADPQLAFLAAREGGHFDMNGKPNWEAIKLAHPNLFATQTPAPRGSGDVGRGNQDPPKADDMNALIRRAAGLQ